MKDPIDALQSHYEALAEQAEQLPDVSVLLPRQRVRVWPMVLAGPLAAALAGYIFLFLCAVPTAIDEPKFNPIAQKQLAIAQLAEDKALASPRSFLWRKRPLV